MIDTFMATGHQWWEVVTAFYILVFTADVGLFGLLCAATFIAVWVALLGVRWVYRFIRRLGMRGKMRKRLEVGEAIVDAVDALVNKGLFTNRQAKALYMEISAKLEIPELAPRNQKRLKSEIKRRMGLNPDAKVAAGPKKADVAADMQALLV